MNYIKLLENCNLCMRNCNVNRNNGARGICNSTNSIRIARAALHFWEEPWKRVREPYFFQTAI